MLITAVLMSICGFVVLFPLGVVGGMVAVVHIPADYFVRARRARGRVWRIVLNVVGWILVAAGLAMLLLPGPGILVSLIGAAMVDFPGKHRVIVWFMSRGAVTRSANALRRRFKKEPLEVPRRGGPPATSQVRATLHTPSTPRM